MEAAESDRARDAPGGESDSDSEADILYERYLDQALAGGLESPEVFCGRLGLRSSNLRARLEGLYRLIGGDREPGEMPVPIAADAGLPWERLGEFRLLRRLGEGGMGMLYLAEQECLGRLVALKVIRPELAARAEAVERFRREAKAIARLRHPNIVAVYAFGEDRGVLFTAMELVPGRSLADVLQEARAATTPPRVRDVLAWLEPIARALAAAHAEGIVHRDVKPSNIRIGPEGRPVLVDFGLARDVAATGATLTQQFTGSPAYASPEQVLGNRDSLDGRTDIYSLGVTLYESLTLAEPFAGESLDQVFHRILHADAPSMRRYRSSIPRDLEIVTQRAMDREPKHRHASARDLADDLLAVLELRPIRSRAPGPLSLLRRWMRSHRAAAAAALVFLAAAATFLLFLLVQEQRRGSARRMEAAALVQQARDLLARQIAARRELGDLAAQVAQVERDVQSNYVPPERARVLDQKARLDSLAREHDLGVLRIEQLLLDAERLTSSVDGVERVRADLYLEQWRMARDVRDFARLPDLALLVRHHDQEHRHLAEIEVNQQCTIVTEPPASEVYLFPLRLQSDIVPGGQHRWVPVPIHGESRVVLPGATVLRVTAGKGELATNDLIIELDGHPVADALFVIEASGPLLPFDRLVRVDGREVRSPFELEAALADSRELHRFEFATSAETLEVLEAANLHTLGIRVGDAAAAAEQAQTSALVFKDGQLCERELPAGLRVRMTAAPLLVSPACRVGTTPIRDLGLSWEPCVALLRHEGYEDVRVVIFPPEGRNMALNVRMLPCGTSPVEMVHVVAPGNRLDPFWIMDREVTCGEYLEFLNDPETQRKIGARAPSPLAPHASTTAPLEGSWPREPGGRFRLAPNFDERWPVLGVTWLAAQEFVAWKNRSAGMAARGLAFALPTLEEWQAAAHGRLTNYVYGETFRPHWFKSCYARATPNPEPVLRYPIDESDLGVFDLTGSVSEWCDSWYDDPAKGMKAVAGGNWGTGDPKDFHAEAAFGAPPNLANGTIGFRLACRRTGDRTTEEHR